MPRYPTLAHRLLFARLLPSDRQFEKRQVGIGFPDLGSNGCLGKYRETIKVIKRGLLLSERLGLKLELKLGWEPAT
jgi:hypothetical protein